MSEREPERRFEDAPLSVLTLFTSQPFPILREGSYDVCESFVTFDRNPNPESKQKTTFTCGVRSMDRVRVSAVQIGVGKKLHLFLPLVVPPVLSRFAELHDHTVLDVTRGVNDFLHDRKRIPDEGESRDYLSAHSLAVGEIPKVDVAQLDALSLLLFADQISVDWRSSARTKNLVELGSAPFLDALAQSNLL